MPVRSRWVRVVAVVAGLVAVAAVAAIGGVTGVGGGSSSKVGGPASAGAPAAVGACGASRAVPNTVRAQAKKPNPDAAVLSPSWRVRPATPAAMEKLATAQFVGEVVKVASGPSLRDPAGGVGVPTQRITLKRCATVEGTIPGTVKLFHTGSAATITEDAPHYSVGERYLMLVRPFVDGSGKKTGEWVLPTPDARMLVDSSGEVHAITGHGKADRAYEGLNIAAPTDAGVARKVSKRDDVPTAKITISDGGGTGTRYWFSSGYWLHPASRTVPIYIAGSTSTQRSYVAAAAAEWDSKTVYALPRTSTLSTTKNLSYNIGNYGDSGWLGLAYGSYHWTATTARTNTYYSADSIERRGIACQEIGHTLGLDHYPGDCMGLGYFASASSYVRAATASDLNLKRNNDGH